MPHAVLTAIPSKHDLFVSQQWKVPVDVFGDNNMLANGKPTYPYAETPKAPFLLRLQHTR